MCGESSAFCTREVVGFCIIDQYASETFSLLQSMRGYGAYGISMQLIHHAHSVTSASCGRRSQFASSPHMSVGARSARWTRVGAPRGGRVARSSRVRWLSPARDPGGSWFLRQMSCCLGMMWRCWRRPEVSLTACALSAADIM
jgi:hypothetical protein